jgi:hypothetical protein
MSWRYFLVQSSSYTRIGCSPLGAFFTFGGELLAKTLIGNRTLEKVGRTFAVGVQPVGDPGETTAYKGEKAGRRRDRCWGGPVLSHLKPELPSLSNLYLQKSLPRRNMHGDLKQTLE